MAPNEEGKEVSEQLFRSYTEAGNGNLVRHRWIMIVVGIGVAICVVAGLVGAEHLLRASPYDDMVSRLHAGMSVPEVEEELGTPYNEGHMAGDSSYSLMYRTNGTKLPLIVQFTDTRIIEKWCVFVPEKSQPNATSPNVRLVCHEVQ